MPNKGATNEENSSTQYTLEIVSFLKGKPQC